MVQAHKKQFQQPARMLCVSRRSKTLLLLTCAISFVAFLLTSSPTAEAKKLDKKLVKSLVKGLVLQNLSTRKNFVPLPVPIPVPIELNDPPVYIKAKPKYVNVYTRPRPKPTPQPVVKPTTVYHMPVYSPTYEYMSMDPMSVYASPMSHFMYNQQHELAVPANYATTSSGATSSAAGGSASTASNQVKSIKSSIHTDADSTSANAGVSFNDYDDELSAHFLAGGNAVAKRRNYPEDLMMSATSETRLRRGLVDAHRAASEDDGDEDETDEHDEANADSHNSRQTSLAAVMPFANDDEQVDEDDQTSNSFQHRRVKRQVQSGYDHSECHGFPLEINVRSRIKMDNIFPIHGKSQMRKCVKLKKLSLFPPADNQYQHQHGPAY